VKPIVRQLRPKRMAHADPFLGTEARARGVVTRRTLRSGHDQVHRDVYIPKGEKLTPATRAVAAWLWSGRQATAAGFSASALYGTRWIDHQLPAELYRRNGKPVDGILITAMSCSMTRFDWLKASPQRRQRAQRSTSAAVAVAPKR
jgi:hypothetical protein